MPCYYYTSWYKDNYWMIWFNEIYEAFYGFKHHFVWLRYKNNELIQLQWDYFRWNCFTFFVCWSFIWLFHPNAPVPHVWVLTATLNKCHNKGWTAKKKSSFYGNRSELMADRLGHPNWLTLKIKKHKVKVIFPSEVLCVTIEIC